MKKSPMAIDSLIPIGHGKLELVIGDRKASKTTVASNTILNKKGQNVIRVYVAIGQKAPVVAQVVNTFEDRGSLEYIIIVAKIPNSLATLQYLVPYIGTALA